MTREEILRGYEEVEFDCGVSPHCRDCDIYRNGCDDKNKPCNVFTIFKRKKEKVMSKCEVVFCMPETKNITSFDIPVGTWFSASLEENDTPKLFYKGDEHKIHRIGNEIYHYAVGAKYYNYQPVNLRIEATPV